MRHFAHDWILSHGEAYVDCFLPHSGGGAVAFIVDSPSQFDALMARTPGADLTILRARQYPLRGIVDDLLLASALALIGDDEAYEIVSIRYYPERIDYIEEGASHAALRAQLSRLFGSSIAIGPTPRIPRSSQEIAAPDVIVLSPNPAKCSSAQ